MKIRIAAAASLLALAMPLSLVAQETKEPVSAVEAVFYKAYYLERGQRDFAGAMALYEEFLAKAPEHALAKEAAMQQFRLLDRTGKTKERDAFKEKYGKLLGNLANVTTRPERGGDAGDEDGGPGQRRQRGQRGEGFGGRGGRGGGMRAVMGLMRSDAKLADMSEEQMTQLKEYLGSADESLDRMSRFLGEETVEKMKKGAATLKTALDAGKMEDAQKALEALRKDWPQMGGRRGGGGGDAGGRGGRGGNRGGGGGGNRGGGGGGGGN